MASPPITVENIRRHIPNFVSILDKGINNRGIGPEGGERTLNRLEPHLEKMSSPEGMNILHPGPRKVHIGWNYDNDNRINGLFVSIYQGYSEPQSSGLHAYKIVASDGGCEDLTVACKDPDGIYYLAHRIQGDTIMRTEGWVIPQSFLTSTIFHGFEEITPYEGEIQINAQCLNHSQIRSFYEKNQAILDNLLHPPPPSPSNSPEPSDTNNRKYYYLAGAFTLLLIGVIYVATQYFSEAKSEPQGSIIK